MKKIYFIIILFIFPLLSEQTDWATTRFEKSWKKSFKEMTFRDPINFSPYNIKISFYNYGGKNFISKLGLNPFSSDEMGSNPFQTSDDTFPNIESLKYRRMIGLELDLLKKNFFYKNRNNIDIQIGLGYKFLQSLNEIKFYDGDKLKPELYEFNLNSTFVFQRSPNNFNYILYSIGYNNASFYKSTSSNKEATGSGIGHSLAFGMNFIIPKNEKAHDLHCGLELKFFKCDIDKISEPDNLNRIDSFNMEAVGLSFSFGIGDGGKKSIADLAYENMLDRNYILASEQFKTYKKREIIYNEEKLDTMLSFCNSQIPYILFERALEKYDEQNFKVSVALLKEIDFSGDANLKDKIESRLYIIADQLINNFFKIRKNNSLEYQIQYLKEIRNISYKVSNEVDKNLSQIYLDKGDILLNNGNYEEAYKYYIHASSVSEVNSERIKIKIDHLVISILNDVYNLLQNKENLIAYEKLFFAKDISSINSDNIDFFMTFVENRISDINADKIRERIINIIKNKQEFVASTTGKDIHLGDSYKDVINILGEPLDRISRSNFNNDYMMLIYSINDVEYKIFFKNKLLIDVERN